jgi:hypothetical protein
MKTGDFKTSKYLRKEDFEEPQILTIKAYKKENVALPSETAEYRAILYFEGQEKGMVANPTNLTRAEHVFGTDDMDQWIGKQIMVYCDPEVEYAGRIVGGLRLRSSKKKSPKFDDLEDIPF